MDRETLLKSAGSIGPIEAFWKSHYVWLKEQGYQLRQRYAPDWIPSWTGTDKYHMLCEDGLMLIRAQLCDAIHISSGARVGLKRLSTKYHPFEEDIHRYFSSETLSDNPRNHCVPLIDVLHPPDEAEDCRILVMPYLRPFDSPNFDTFGEAVECIRQMFVGLQFMHEHHVAHRDLNMTNFMMESKDMFPEGYHPLNIDRNSAMSGPAKYFTRTQRPPKYYIIDFGISRQYDASNTSPLEPIILGGDSTVPEFQNPTEDQNPYWTDVYYAGNLVREYFIEGHAIMTTIRGYRGFGFLKPLINDMVQDDPSRRPTMEEVVKRFDVIVSGRSKWKLRSRTPWRRANIFQGVAHIVSHWKRRIVFVVKNTPAIPFPAWDNSRN